MQNLNINLGQIYLYIITLQLWNKENKLENKYGLVKKKKKELKCNFSLKMC